MKISGWKKKRSNHSDEIRCCCSSHGAQFVITGSVDKTLKCWDIESRTLVHTYAEHKEPVSSHSMSH